MRRFALALSLAVVGLLASSPEQAEAAPPSLRERQAELHQLASRELELTTTAQGLARSKVALERERESLEWTTALLSRRAREGLRLLDSYRSRRVERAALGEQRARELYKLARGGGVLEIMFEDGEHGHLTAKQRRARADVIQRLVAHDLDILRVHGEAEAKARDELLTATRELRVAATLESVARLQSNLIELTSSKVDTALASTSTERRTLQEQLRGSIRFDDLKLLTSVNQARRELLRARGLDLLEKNSLVRPVRGQLVGPFGAYEDPLLAVPMHRNGVELGARNNDIVKALAPGEVVLVGALPGFERVVVIDHGGGYLSLTARLMTIGVEEGDELEAGAVLGRVGPKAVDDGLGTTVYVELRHGQRPIDPTPYLGG